MEIPLHQNFGRLCNACLRPRFNGMLPAKPRRIAVPLIENFGCTEDPGALRAGPEIQARYGPTHGALALDNACPDAVDGPLQLGLRLRPPLGQIVAR